MGNWGRMFVLFLPYRLVAAVGMLRSPHGGTARWVGAGRGATVTVVVVVGTAVDGVLVAAADAVTVARVGTGAATGSVG
jgi:hypothetical protein